MGEGVGLPVAVARMHGNGDEAGGVVTLQQGLLQLIHRYAEVVEWHVRILLQLIAETPQDD